MELRDKVIFISGASSGLGRALAEKLSEYKTKIVILARRRDLLEDVEKVIRLNGSECFIIEADVSDSAQASKAVVNAIQAFARIDIAVLAVGGGRPLTIAEASPEEILSSMKVNYSTLINVFVPLVSQLKRQSSPSVIAQINSLASWIEFPRGAHYSAAKNAAKSFFDSARIELKDSNISFLTIYPGFIQTDNKKEKMIMGISVDQAITHIIYAIKNEKRDYGFPFGLKLLFRVLGSLPWCIKARIISRLAARESKKYTD